VSSNDPACFAPWHTPRNTSPHAGSAAHREALAHSFRHSQSEETVMANETKKPQQPDTRTDKMAPRPNEQRQPQSQQGEQGQQQGRQPQRQPQQSAPGQSGKDQDRQPMRQGQGPQGTEDAQSDRQRTGARPGADIERDEDQDLDRDTPDQGQKGDINRGR
jgi:hypothetical protein